MKTITFYHQKRRDGGVRTDIELQGDRLLEIFKPGRGEPDSALDWFVDVRSRGRNLPSDPEAVRELLLRWGDQIGIHLEQMATDLHAGIDPDWPFTSDVFISAAGVTTEIVCSAVRRLSGREIGRVLLKLKRDWPRLIESLRAFPAQQAA